MTRHRTQRSEEQGESSQCPGKSIDQCSRDVQFLTTHTLLIDSHSHSLLDHRACRTLCTPHLVLRLSFFLFPLPFLSCPPLSFFFSLSLSVLHSRVSRSFLLVNLSLNSAAPAIWTVIRHFLGRRVGAVVSQLDKTDDGVGHDRVSISRVSPRTMGLPKTKPVYKRCLFSLKSNVDKKKIKLVNIRKKTLSVILSLFH